MLQSVSQSFSHSVIQSFSHSVNHSFVHSVIHSFIHSLTQSFIHSLTHSLTLIHSVVHSVAHPFIHSCVHSFFHWFMACRFISFISCVSFHVNSLLSNSPRIPISKLVPIAMSYFWNFRPGACRVLPDTIHHFWGIVYLLREQSIYVRWGNRRIWLIWMVRPK